MDDRETAKGWRAMVLWAPYGTLAAVVLAFCLIAKGGGSVALVVAGLAGLVVVRTLLELRTRIVLDNDALIIMGPLRTTRVPWSSFERITLHRFLWLYRARLWSGDRHVGIALCQGNVYALTRLHAAITRRAGTPAAPRIESAGT